MKKSYQQILPMDENSTVIAQFGWLPLSVFRPERRPEWKDAVQDDGDITTRRSKDCKYLPNLRFSEFPAHLAEVAIRYWTQANELIVDPFAGRATRGLVALELGRQYQGYEVAPRTFHSTLAKLAPMGGRLECFDGCTMAHTLNNSADCVFTCPPYHQLERYEAAPAQLSEIGNYQDFLARIAVCAKNVFRVLKPGRFLLWVCADWRDGEFRLFHKHSIDLFEAAGLSTYDIIIIHNNSPFAPLQAAKVAAKRYTSKTHEYLLVFRKPASETVGG